MSYNVAITRRTGLASQPIRQPELHYAAASDPSWSVISPTEEYELWRLARRGTNGADDLYVDLEDGELVATNPNDDEIQELRRIAFALDARVIGEDGEDLTNPRPNEPWWSTAAVVLIALSALAVLIWAQHKFSERW